MSNRLNDAMTKLGAESQRTPLGRPPPSPGNKRNSGLDPSTINAMFPDAAAAIAKKKAEYTQQTGNAPTSNRNSAAFADRSSLVAPTISAPTDVNKENMGQSSSSPWAQRHTEARPKSSSGQPPMGQFTQPPPSAGLRSPRPLHLSGSSGMQSTNVNVPEHHSTGELPLLSPYNVNASWASMTNTPMVPNFHSQQAATQADMVANATAMKLAALSTVNNRIALDDVRKYRRARSNDGQLSGGQMSMSPGLSGTNVLVVNESGQLLNSQPLSAQQLATLQMQQQAALAGHRSRPNSPGLAMQGGNFGGIGFASPQNNGYLAAYDGTSGINSGMGGLSLGQFGMGHGGHEGYLSDHSEMTRGRSPRGKRGTSKPPEDPTDPSLLQDIPSWLRSLRLHKYTDNLKDMNWTELIELDDKGLDDRGVNALGARRKMLKVRVLQSAIWAFTKIWLRFLSRSRKPGLRAKYESSKFPIRSSTRRALLAEHEWFPRNPHSTPFLDLCLNLVLISCCIKIMKTPCFLLACCSSFPSSEHCSNTYGKRNGRYWWWSAVCTSLGIATATDILNTVCK